MDSGTPEPVHSASYLRTQYTPGTGSSIVWTDTFEIS
jgi:hypothetical protein